MNRIIIEPTKFVNVRSGEETLGYRIYDGYVKYYTNSLDSIPADDMKLLTIISTNDDDEVIVLIQHIIMNKCGVEIGGEWYDFDEIKEAIGA